MALIDTIISNGNVIKNETVTGSNTAARVGLAIADLAEYAKSISDEGAASADSVQLGLAAGIAVAEGQIAWNAVDGTLDVGMAGGNAVLQVGQETYMHVVAGEAITNGDVVYASGTNGASGSIIASKFLADGATRAYLILGVATESIASGASGYVTAFGKLRGLDTSGFTAGAILYPSPTVAGALTDVLPESPQVAMPIAFAVNSKANGTVAVRLTPPNELAELHDVHLTTPVADGELLVYDSVAGHWDNKTLTEAGIGDGATLENIVVVTTANVASTLGGVIDSTKEYFLDGRIDMGTTQITVPTGGITLRGYSNDISGLKSVADNYTMFISETPEIGSGNVLGFDYHVEVTGTGSKVYELYSATGFDAFEFARVNYDNCTSLGDIHSYRQGLEDGTGRFGGSPSLTLHGTWVGGYKIVTSIVRSMSDTTTEPLFKAGTAFVMNSRFYTDMNVDLGSLQPLLDFVPANFPNHHTLQLKEMIVSRDFVFDNTDANITPNISELDEASEWLSNDGIPNTPTYQVKTYQFELNNFQKGNLAPTSVKIGSAPEVNGLLLDNINSKIAFNFMIPLDWDSDTDMQLMAMVAIPSAVTAIVGDKIQMKVEHRVTRSGAVTKLDDVGLVHDTDQPQGTAPYGAVNDNVILTGKNTQYYTYMPHIILPVSTIGGIGGVLSGELSLQDLGVGNVDSIIVYQMHLNYKGFNLN